MRKINKTTYISGVSCVLKDLSRSFVKKKQVQNTFNLLKNHNFGCFQNPQIFVAFAIYGMLF